jgi:hypothetical protein
MQGRGAKVWPIDRDCVVALGLPLGITRFCIIAEARCADELCPR